PHSADPYNYIGAVLLKNKRAAEAVPFFDRAIELEPTLAAAQLNRASALLHLNRPEEALINAQQAIVLDPDLPYVWSRLSTAERAVFDWSEGGSAHAHVLFLARDKPTDVEPLTTLYLTDDPFLQQNVARAHAPQVFAPVAPVPQGAEVLRVAYLSADFGD